MVDQCGLDVMTVMTAQVLTQTGPSSPQVSKTRITIATPSSIKEVALSTVQPVNLGAHCELMPIVW